MEDDDRGKYFNRDEKDYVNTFSERNYWNKMIVEYMKNYRGNKPAATASFGDYIRLMNLLDENAKLMKLTSELL